MQGCSPDRRQPGHLRDRLGGRRQMLFGREAQDEQGLPSLVGHLHPPLRAIPELPMSGARRRGDLGELRLVQSPDYPSPQISRLVNGWDRLAFRVVVGDLLAARLPGVLHVCGRSLTAARATEVDRGYGRRNCEQVGCSAPRAGNLELQIGHPAPPISPRAIGTRIGTQRLGMSRDGAGQRPSPDRRNARKSGRGITG